MKKIIPFIVVIVVALAAFFGLQHFTGNTTTAETVKEEISLPDLTVENTSVQEVAPTPAPAVVSAPTEDPQLMYVMKDSATGKIFYQADSEEVVLKRIRESITAEEAVNAVECVEYGAMMVVDHDDERIIDGISAYDLISDEAALKVTFNRNGSKLFVCDEKEFKPSEKSDKTFKGLGDKKAYASWICSEHTAFKSSALVFEGYPKSEGYRGPFAVADGFSAKVLKSVRLIHTEGNRYDWVLVSCDCKDAVPTKKPSGGNGGGNGGGSKPTQQPTQAPTQAPTQEPTQEPENNSRPSANPTQKPTQAPENNSRPSAKPTAKPTQAPTKAPETEPESNSRPNTGSGTPSTESTGGSTAGESSGRPNTGSGSSTSEGSGRPNVSGNTGSGNVSSDADPFA